MTTTPLIVSDQLLEAKDYRNLIVVYRNGAPVRLSDLGRVIDSVEDVRNLGLADGKPAVLIQIRRQPNANVVDTVKRIKDMLPRFKASLPPTVDFKIENDRTITIRDSVRDAQRNMVISIGLVILVVFVFLRNGWATFIPSVSVPVSLIATFGAMYLLGYNLDNLSLMGLTIATGFVVDDAIVVIENITRHIENGMPAMRAALQGRGGNRLHRALDEHLADCRVYPDPHDAAASSAACSGSSPSFSPFRLPCRWPFR